MRRGSGGGGKILVEDNYFSRLMRKIKGFGVKIGGNDKVVAIQEILEEVLKKIP